jgi:hypothetical protein
MNAASETHGSKVLVQHLIGALMAVALTLCGCVHNVAAMRLSANPLKVKEQIRRQVPFGTPLNVAEEKMRHLGFDCEFRRRGEFGDQITASGERGEYRRYKDIDYLVCVQQLVIPCILHRMWVIGLVCDENQRVTNILVQVWNHNYP